LSHWWQKCRDIVWKSTWTYHSSIGLYWRQIPRVSSSHIGS
jgi:hypothetical protein